jgi:hypothetical protein
MHLGIDFMPIHDWTRVTSGTFHAFHTAWIAQLQETLNAGLLPADYYALAEQFAGDMGPDVLTLETPGRAGRDEGEREPEGGIAIAERPPRVQNTVTASSAFYLARRRTLVVRHASDDRVVALLEIVSQGNKSKRTAVDTFVTKAVAALQQGYHLLIVDLYPPTRHAPDGVHGAIWAEIDDVTYESSPDRPLTLVAYSAGVPPTAYVQPVGVGEVLPDMPLFLSPDRYVDVPLEITYAAAWRGMPQRWRRELEVV